MVWSYMNPGVYHVDRANILIVRLSSIGDVVHTLPSLVALRRHFPEARIDWLVESSCREVLLDNPDMSDLLEVDTVRWRRRLYSPRIWADVVRTIRHLRARRYDVVLDLQGTIKSAVAAFLVKGDRRIGFALSDLKERMAALLYTERVTPNGSRPHVIDRNLSLLTALGLETKERAFPIVVTESMERGAARTLEELGLSEYVVLNPGGSWPTKRWSPEKFGALASEIARKWELPSLVLHGPGEEGIAERVVEHSNGASLIAPGLGLREMIPYLQRARLFISGDTGPMHIASAFQVPVVGIFGPTDPARNGPFGQADEAIAKAVPCGPCYKHRCPGYDNVCLVSIEVAEVLDAVRRRLGE